MRTRHLTPAAVLLVLLPAVATLAQEAPADPLTASLGFSWLATSGNSDSSTLGLDFTLKRLPEPWGYEAAANALRAEEDGERTAERYGARGRASRALDERWSVFAGLSGERDRFAGVDLRAIAEGGVAWQAVKSTLHELSFDGGLTWTNEDMTATGTDSFFGAVAGLAYAFKPREGTALTERVLVYPSLEDGDDWRLTSETAVQAALTGRLGLKVGFAVRRDNEPPPGFEKTDTTTTVSLVLTL